MKKKKKSKPPPRIEDAEQSKRFVDAAKRLDADESGRSFERALASVVPAKTPGRLKGRSGD